MFLKNYQKYTRITIICLSVTLIILMILVYYYGDLYDSLCLIDDSYINQKIAYELKNKEMSKEIEQLKKELSVEEMVLSATKPTSIVAYSTAFIVICYVGVVTIKGFFK